MGRDHPFRIYILLGNIPLALGMPALPSPLYSVLAESPVADEARQDSSRPERPFVQSKSDYVTGLDGSHKIKLGGRAEF